MIIWSSGNLFDSGADILVNTVNCFGVMGAGIALQFKQRFPKMFEQYKKDCYLGLVKPGGINLYKHESIWICNAATKDHWKNPSQLQWIESILQRLSTPKKPVSFALPPLGCSNGKLSWNNQVRPLVIKYLQDVSNNYFIYGPRGNHDSI